MCGWVRASAYGRCPIIGVAQSGAGAPPKVRVLATVVQHLLGGGDYGSRTRTVIQCKRGHSDIIRVS